MKGRIMERRTFLKTAGVAGALTMAAQADARAAGGERRPNIILYITDDQGMNDAGCYGHPLARTPGLDALAAEGMRFTSAYCVCASCSPSRSVLLTGMHPHANGQYGLAHAKHNFASFENVQSLPNLLRDAGYRTLCVGKYHVRPEPAYHFDEYIKVMAPDKMAEAARPFIAAADDRPFFLNFNTVEPHRPFHRDGAATVSPDAVPVPEYLPDIPECREELAEYLASIERADQGLARLIDILKAAGHWDDTVMVFVSDNGAPFPGAKTTVYEPGLRLPCVARDPANAQQGVVSDAMISFADITPTLLDYAGATPKNPQFQGRSFRSILQGADPGADWDEIYASHTFHEVTMYYPMRMVRTRRHKLIWNIAHGLPYPFASDLWNSKTWQAVMQRGLTHYGKRSLDAYIHRPRFELYDLETDPDEVVNLASDPAHAGLLAQLHQKLRAFQERTRDPWILKWDRE